MASLIYTKSKRGNNIHISNEYLHISFKTERGHINICLFDTNYDSPTWKHGSFHNKYTQMYTI